MELKASPQVFYQLFTVHAVYNGQHFPFVYALLPNKNNHHLQSLFCKAQRMLPKKCLSFCCSFWLWRRHHLFYCTSISRSMPVRLLLPFLISSMGSCPKPWATPAHDELKILYRPTDGSGILTRVGDLDILLSYFENTWLDGGQFSPAERSVLNWAGLKQTK